MSNERDTDFIDEDYMVWRVAYDEYFGHDDEAEAETRKLLKRIRATAWEEGYEAGSNDVELHLNALNGYTDYDEYEDAPNPYRDNT